MNVAQIIAAVSPDAWVPLSLPGGFTAHGGGYTPAARIHGDTVELCGRIDGTIASGGVTVATLDAAHTPAFNVFVSSSGPGALPAFLTIGTGSAISVATAATQSGISLDGISYRLV